MAKTPIGGATSGELPVDYIILTCQADNDRTATSKRFPLPDDSFVEICEDFSDQVEDEDGISNYSTYSNVLWDGCLFLSALLRQQPWRVRGRRVLEIGSGLGLPSIVAAALGGRSVATEQQPLTLLTREAKRNADLVRRAAETWEGASLEVQELDWTWPPEEAVAKLGVFDLVMGCDILAGVKAGNKHFCQVLKLVGLVLGSSDANREPPRRELPIYSLKAIC